MEKVIQKIGKSRYFLFYPESFIWLLGDNLQELKGYEVNEDILRECAEKVKKLRDEVKIKFAELHLTEKCNLSCSYCFIPDDKRKETYKMPKGEAEKITMQIADYAERNRVSILISFQGGEPLLCKSDIMDLIDVFHGDRLITFTLQTNGTLIDEDFTSFLKERNISIGVSLDGFKEVHDFQRRYAGSDEGTFETIFSGIKLLIEKGINFGVITTITKHNVDYLNEIIDFYYKSGVKSVLLNPIEPNNINALNLMPDKKRLLLRYAQCIENTYRINKKNPNNRIEIANVRDLLLALTTDFEPRVCCMSPCGAGRNIISITCKGDVYPCSCLIGFNEMKMGNLLNENIESILNSRSTITLRTRRVENIDGCNGCPYRYMCGANCPSSVYFAHHGLNYPSIYCKLVPTMISRALQLIAEDMEINDIYYFMGESFKQLVESKLKDGEFYDFF